MLLEDKLKPYPTIWYYTMMFLGADNAEPIKSESHLWGMLFLMSKIDPKLHEEMISAYAIIPKEFRNYYEKENKSRNSQREASKTDS